MVKVNKLLLIIAIISALLYPFWIVQVISITIILTYLFAFIISRYMFNNVFASRERTIYYCQNGQVEHSDFTILNRGFIPLDNILITDRGSGCYNNGIGEFLDTIPGKQSSQFINILNTGIRGSHKIGPIIVKGSDPLNFFPWTKTLEVYCEVIIYPRFHDIRLLLTQGERGGKQRVKNPLYEDLSDLKSMREFRRGDSLKRVNWKATAKVGVLQIMEFSNTLSAPLFILMDIDPENYPIKHRYTYLERTIEAAASLTTSYSDKSEAIGLITHDKSGTILIPQSRGYSHTVSVLEHLAKIDFEKHHEVNIIDLFFEQKISLPQGSHFYILTPTITVELIQKLQLLKRKYIVKIVITGGGVSIMSANIECYTLTSYGKEYFE
ncbi:MAG: DUF58 domain-containing protein [Spirochaetaceae bacterium]